MKAAWLNETSNYAELISPVLTPTADWWLSFRLGLKPADVTTWTTTGLEACFFNARLLSPSYHLRGFFGDPAALGTNWFIDDLAFDPPAPTVGWQDCETHYDSGSDSLEFYIGGVLVASGGTFGAAGHTLNFFTLGETGTGDFGASLYFADVKVGTARGLGDLFADDFSSGTFAAWDGTDGDVSIVDDPFPPAPQAVCNSRFYFGYEWAELVTDLDSNSLTGLSKLAAARELSYALNKPASAKGVVPSDDPRVNAGVLIGTGPDFAPALSYNERLLYMFRREAQGTGPPWVCRWAGLVMQIEDAAQGDQPYSAYTAYDPWQYLFARPVMNGTALVGPDGISWSDTRGDVIAKQIVDATIALHGPCFIDTDLGTFEATEPIDINFQQGTSVGQALQQLAATGTLDIVMEPVYDPVGLPGICSIMHVYVQAGAPRNEAIFSWDVGRAVTGISDLLDGDLMANRVQFYAGQGGPPTLPADDPDSEARYGWWEAQQFFPASPPSDPAQLVAFNFSVNRMAEFQLSLRKHGKRSVVLTPASLLSPIPLLDYGLGDRVPVYATSRLRQPIPSSAPLPAPPPPVPPTYARVYGIDISLSDDGVEQVSRLVTSPDGF